MTQYVGNGPPRVCRLPFEEPPYLLTVFSAHLEAQFHLEGSVALQLRSLGHCLVNTSDSNLLFTLLVHGYGLIFCSHLCLVNIKELVCMSLTSHVPYHTDHMIAQFLCSLRLFDISTSERNIWRLSTINTAENAH